MGVLGFGWGASVASMLQTFDDRLAGAVLVAPVPRPQREAMLGLRPELVAELASAHWSEDRVCELLEPWFAERDFTAIAEQLEAAGVCWGKYQTLSELVHTDIDCSTDNPLFEQIEQPGIGEYLMPQNPLGFTAADRHPVRPAPRLGQHTDEILTEILGLSSGEIARYHDAGTVAGA